MSFFKDFKDDLSQAVNELMPEDKNQVADDVQMVDTLTEDNDVSEPSIEEMLNNIEHMDLDSLTAENSSEAMPEEEVIEIGRAHV